MANFVIPDETVTVAEYPLWLIADFIFTFYIHFSAFNSKARVEIES